MYMQKGEYSRGRRVKADELRKVYKLYQALILEALVDEVPTAIVVEKFFPNSGGTLQSRINRYLKDVQDLQVNDFTCGWLP
jgi:hypothetical protein